MKIKSCSQCGCERNILIQAKVRVQAPEPVEISYKWLCFDCLLKMFKFYDCISHIIDYKMIMETVKDVNSFRKQPD